jgi:hypothetical protein
MLIWTGPLFKQKELRLQGVLTKRVRRLNDCIEFGKILKNIVADYSSLDRLLDEITLGFQNFSNIVSGLAFFKAESVVTILACRMSATASR